MYLITAALPYANGPLHIGHLAGVYIPADIYARYLRLKGEEVFFICGSDEHGVPITLKARKEKTTPQKIVDKYHLLNKKSFEELKISFDIYSRTSSKIHHEFASNFFLNLYENNILEIHESEQYYDEKDKIFLADRYIKGNCPICNFEDAYGDQCEKCGSTLSPSELINPKSAISGTSPLLKKTKHWYFPLNKYQQKLENWILEDHKEDFKTNVYGQCKSWLDEGLKPRAVTRDLDWGVKVPLKSSDGKVLYVWFDAPIGYISATQELLEEKKSSKTYKDYWYNKNTKLIHFVGKDNIVFHCIMFPAMLMAHDKYILPKNIPANEFMNLEGKKLSTSKNWAVWVPEFLEKYPEKQDILRYVLTANIPETKDSDFTWQDFKTRNNSELVGIVGNFINRCLILTKKYFNSKIPNINELDEIDQTVIKSISDIPNKLENALKKFKFREALNYWIEISRIGNKYLADTEPWKIFSNTKKEKNINQKKRIETIINLSLQIAANITVLSQIFMPYTYDKLKKMLNISDYNSKWASLGRIDILKKNHLLGEIEILFDKIEDL